MNGFIDMSRWAMPNTVIPDGFDSQFTPSLGAYGGTGSLGLSDWMGQSGGLGGGGFMDSLRSSGFLGTDGNQGWGGAALGAIGGLGNAFMSMRNYGLARDALASSKDQFNKNYAAQRDTINTQLEDRQRARVAANPNSESVESYLARNRIK